MLLLSLAWMQLATGQTIDAYEYFWDDDPGEGNGVLTTVSPTSLIDLDVNVSTADLSDGYHILGIRVRHTPNVWGFVTYQKFYVRNIAQAEYFWDEDPGAGNGTAISYASTDLSIATNFEISTSGLAGGVHKLGIRMRGDDASWGPVHYDDYTVDVEYLEGEYFWNTDPGVGNATTFALTPGQNSLDETIQINNFGLGAGLHKLYTRVRGVGGSFGPTKETNIYISRVIVGGEYFWDTDPGVGNGFPLNTLNAGTTAQTCDVASTVGLTVGEHYLYVRTVSDDNVWSIPSRIQMTVTPNDVLVGCPGDYDRSGMIDTSDLLIFLSGFGSSGECTVDLNGDFVVDTTDLLIFLGSFGSICE